MGGRRYVHFSSLDRPVLIWTTVDKSLKPFLRGLVDPTSVRDPELPVGLKVLSLFPPSIVRCLPKRRTSGRLAM